MKGQNTKHEVPEHAMFWKISDSEERPKYHLEVRRNGQPVKERKYHVIPRVGPPHGFGVFNNSVDAVERALVERYFLCKTGNEFLPALVTSPAEWTRTHLDTFRSKVVDDVSKLATVVSLRDVVTCYTGAKRRVYERAWRSLQRRALHPGDANLRPFTKFEKQLLTKAPRIINPRSPRYNLSLGRYLKKAEKIYFAAINEAWESTTSHTVIKGLNVFESAAVLKAKWDRFKRPVALGLDAEKYDMHVGVNALKYEHGFYNQVFGTPDLRDLLRQQLHNKGVARCPDGEVVFRIAGTRCSGDLNTSLGNCLLMCALIYALCRELGVEAELANNGDDCVLMFEEENLDRVLDEVPLFFARYGFRMQVEDPAYEFEQVEFCQSRPVRLGGGWAMVRNVRTCLKKDPICLIPIQNDRVWRKWLAAVGECGLATVPGCPVLQSFYRAFMRSGTRCTRRFADAVFRNTSAMERAGGLSAVEAVVTDEARVSFYNAFGILPDMQLELEKYYDGVTIGSVVNCEQQSGVVEMRPIPMLRHL